eukprot:COSAG03_NODE_4337_length_1586_cov_2082.221251_1_plen_181_part_00
MIHVSTARVWTPHRRLSRPSPRQEDPARLTNPRTLSSRCHRRGWWLLLSSRRPRRRDATKWKRSPEREEIQGQQRPLRCSPVGATAMWLPRQRKSYTCLVLSSQCAAMICMNSATIPRRTCRRRAPPLSVLALSMPWHSRANNPLRPMGFSARHSSRRSTKRLRRAMRPKLYTRTTDRPT